MVCPDPGFKAANRTPTVATTTSQVVTMQSRLCQLFVKGSHPQGGQTEPHASRRNPVQHRYSRAIHSPINTPRSSSPNTRTFIFPAQNREIFPMARVCPPDASQFIPIDSSSSIGVRIGSRKIGQTKTQGIPNDRDHLDCLALSRNPGNFLRF